MKNAIFVDKFIALFITDKVYFTWLTIILSFLCKSDKIRPHKNIGEKMSNPENDDMDEQEFFTGDIDTDAIEASVRSMLSAFGEDPTREGLQNTPKRVARMYPELLSGYRTDSK